MLKEYLAELQKTPLLSREEETELWQRYAGGDVMIINAALLSAYLPCTASAAECLTFCMWRTAQKVFRWTIPMRQA